jgi:predicted ATPase
VKADFLSRYTPRLISPQVLENIFVQRQELAQELVDRIRESVLTSAKHHTLLTGSRGIGKTHLVSLVYHRIRKMDDLRVSEASPQENRILIAWLSEEEWSVTSFLDLLLCIFQALQEEFNNSKGAQPCAPKERVESLYEMPVDAAESEGAALLKEFIGDSSNGGGDVPPERLYDSRTLLLLVENLDDLFAGLGKDGQKQLRTFLEENSCIVLATAQSYFKDVKQKNSPFYGFFCHEELKELKADDATQLLANIAKHNKMTN